MKIVFLGTNGWFDTPLANTVCILIQTDKVNIIFEAGSGIYKLDNHIKNKNPIYLFLSHLHLDRIIGLYLLAKFNFPQGMPIFVSPRTKVFLKRIISHHYTMPFKRLKFSVKVKEFCRKNFSSFRVGGYKLRHSSICWGYRAEIEGEIIAYGVDTGVCSNLYKLAEKVDIFIAECFCPPTKKSTDWFHLNPETAAKVAKRSSVKKLFLTHFDAYLYPTKKRRKMAEKWAKEIFPYSYASYDDMV